MSKPHLTFAVARQLAHNVIVEYGADHRYEAPGVAGACMYTDVTNEGLCPSCFVGIVLARFGVSLTALEYIDNNRGNSAKCLFIHNLDRLGITVDEQAATFLARFQELQDEEIPWGECMTDAVSLAGGNPEWIRDAHSNFGCRYPLGDVIE